jgi:serine phosphatase RsbU (regulator of sigma subunit)
MSASFVKHFDKGEDFIRQQREIAESLKYASYIQRALFPAEIAVRQLIPEHFIFYQPKELVSGDFYYTTKKGNRIYIAVGDCTGHGVPGAFMSILGITFLNEIIGMGQNFSAASVLNRMREYVMKALCQTGNAAEPKDGIDLALCIFDPVEQTIDFAGAMNPLYIIRDGKLLEYQGDNMPVGIGAEEERPFTSHVISLQESDTLYLFTDGYVDQFGGANQKKFKYKKFRDLLLKTYCLPLHEQKKAISDTFQAWKGNLGQLDDVLVCGFRFYYPVS